MRVIVFHSFLSTENHFIAHVLGGGGSWRGEHTAGSIQVTGSEAGAGGHDPGAWGRPGWRLQLLPLLLLLLEPGSVGPGLARVSL